MHLLMRYTRFLQLFFVRSVVQRSLLNLYAKFFCL